MGGGWWEKWEMQGKRGKVGGAGFYIAFAVVVTAEH